MDQIDKRILQALQQNGKLQNNELAQLVGLSPSPCLRRVKQLEDEGYIEKYVLTESVKIEFKFNGDLRGFG
jgi:Transcriptional regulators